MHESLGSADLYRNDDLNRALTRLDEPAFLLDSDVMGALRQPTRTLREWMDRHSHRTFVFHPAVLAEDRIGRAKAAGDPGYAASLDRASMGVLSTWMDHCVHASDALAATSASIWTCPWVAQFVAGEPTASLDDVRALKRRLEIVAAANTYGFVILSGDGFYKKLATATTSIPHGVYDPRRDRWLVAEGHRLGLARARFDRSMANVG